MFRPVSKKKNEISIDEAKDLLSSERRGVFAVNGDDGYPYAIPVNYLYLRDENRIVFHGGPTGHKVDALKSSDKVCFTVFGGETIRDEAWAPYMSSTVVFGRGRIIKDEADKLYTLKKFAMKYYPSEDMADEEIEISARFVEMFEVIIEHISGKQVQEK